MQNTLESGKVEISRGDRRGLAWEVEGGWFYSAWIHNGKLLAHNESHPVSEEEAVGRIEDVIARSW